MNIEEPDYEEESGYEEELVDMDNTGNNVDAWDDTED